MDGVQEGDHVENLAGPASAIQPIDHGSVHRICSGQVVLNLATAIKELVENSLDAGANNIEVRLKEYGSELVEVVDNGSGVDQANFQGLTLKHHTSKLKDFSDLTSVDTFGFRGEALSSLCALSNLSIITCHENASVGTKLEYDYHGKIAQKTPCARQRGTTVNLQNLFHTLPVRHKEFQRNLKKEFAKMAQVLNAYCIVATGVRITCTNQVGKGKKNIIVSTNGNDTVKENITNIFGTKQLQSLLEFEQCHPKEDVCAEYNIRRPEADRKIFNIQGFVSTVEHGHGRGSTDRQFYFVNKRPCDLSKVSRVVNEAYHQFNRHQYPFVVLDISLEKDAVDVNVTPDKRQIFLQEEKLLLATIKSSLMRLFEPKASVYQMSQPGVRGRCEITGVKLEMDSKMVDFVVKKYDYRVSEFKKTLSTSLGSIFSRKSSSASTPSPLKKHSSCPETSKNSLTSSLANLKRSFSSSFYKDHDSGKFQNDCEPSSKQRRMDGFVSKSTSKSVKQSSSNFTICESSSFTKDEQNERILQQTVSEATLLPEHGVKNTKPNVIIIEHEGTCANSSSSNLSHESGIDVGLDSQGTSGSSNFDSVLSPSLSVESVEEKDSENETVTGGFTGAQSFGPSDSNAKPSCSWVSDELVIVLDKGNLRDRNKLDSSQSSEDTENKEELEQATASGPETLLDSAEKVKKREVSVPFTFCRLRKTLEDKHKACQEEKVRVRGFRAKITPGDNKSAEDELKKEIRKDMFPKMEILGQFNLGFIIGKLDQDLFIIDQHATDEKYNFEMLQRNTVIKSQKLIQPQNLELTAANECILIDNLQIFQKNGFDFYIDEQAPPTQRVKLTSMPVSQNWTFGKDDIEELIFMLSDSPGVLCRPTRVRAMFASRSCRKSIMIGTALNHAEMKKLVGHMAEIDQPWNCPHGRPTMRHLINLNTLPD